MERKPENTSRFDRNLHVILEFAKQPKKLGITSKNITFSGGNKLFAGSLRTNLDEVNADVVQFTKR